MKNDFKILLAEDSSTAAEFFVLTALAIGGHAEVARTGVEAVQMIKKNVFDIVFMDIEMPEMNGIEASKIISGMKARGEIRDIPVVALTGHDLKKTHADFKDAGFADAVTKPIRQKQLLETIQKHLNLQKENSPAPEGKKILQHEMDLIIDPVMAAEAKENFGERYEGALDRFAHNGAVRIQTISNEWLGARDLEKMAFEAHALISSSACLGAVALPRYASELEKAIRAMIKGQGNDGEISTLILEVAQAFDTASKTLCHNRNLN